MGITNGLNKAGRKGESEEEGAGNRGEALLLARSGHVRAMHDLTEGGLVASLNEVAEASGTGFEIEETSLPVSEEVSRMAEAYGLRRRQILSMSSTGTTSVSKSPE